MTVEMPYGMAVSVNIIGEHLRNPKGRDDVAAGIADSIVKHVGGVVATNIADLGWDLDDERTLQPVLKLVVTVVGSVPFRVTHLDLKLVITRAVKWCHVSLDTLSVAHNCMVGSPDAALN